MVGKAGTRMSYHSSGGAPIASRHPSLRRLAMVGCCVLCQAEAAAPPPAANQWQHHHENVYISRILGLILTYLQYFWIYFSEYILSDLHTEDVAYNTVELRVGDSLHAVNRFFVWTFLYILFVPRNQYCI
jgi:hypothetical protein